MAFIEIRVPQKFTNPEGLLRIPDVTTGLKVDLSADTLTGAEGSTVTQWQSSGSAPALLDRVVDSSTTLPTLTLDGPDGGRAVKFTGGQSISTGPGYIAAEEGQPATVVVVFRNDATDINQRILGVDVGGSSYRYLRVTRYQGVQAYSSTATAGEQQFSIQGILTTGEWVIAAVTYGESETTLRVFGKGTSSSPMALGAMTGLALGASPVGVEPMTGLIARVLIYDRPLGDFDADAIMSLLAKEYGIGGD